MKVGAVEALGENAGSTIGTRISMEDRAFRSAFENAIVLRCAVYLDPDNKRLAEMVASVTRIWMTWHGKMAKALRSCSDAEQWWLDQMTGGFMASVRETLQVVDSQVALVLAGFVVTRVGAKGALEQEVVIEDDMADVLGQLCVSLGYHRIRRCLHLFAYPYKFLLCLGGPKLARDVLADFRHEQRVWQAFEAIAPKSDEQEKVARRSLWHKVSVKQLAAAVASCPDELSPAVLEHCKKRARLLLGTLPVEEVIGAQKNSKACKLGRQFKKPEYSMAAAIKAKVLDVRCSFQTPTLDIPVPSKSTRLDADCFQVNREHRSLKFQEIATTSTTPDFYSPAAQNLNSPYADAVTMKVCA